MRRVATVAALGLALSVLGVAPRAEARAGWAERSQEVLGSVRVGVHTVSILIAYGSDSALVEARVPGSDGKPRYIPLIGSTDRGVSSFRLEVSSPDSGDEIWIRMSSPRRALLAHYRFGEKTALTPFGRIELLRTPFPEHVSGGPVPFPKKGQAAARPRASFYHYGGS